MLYNYQQPVYDYILQNKYAGIFLKMGSGKTVIMLTALQQLIKEKKISKVLIVSSLRVVKNVWPREVEKFDHLKSLRVGIAVGSLKQRREILEGDYDIVTVNREYLSKVIELGLHMFFDCLVVDESTSFKRANTKRFKDLRKVLGGFKRRYVLTGTPYTEDYIDLWPQIYILDQGERLGQYITHFLDKYYIKVLFSTFHKYKLIQGSEYEILDLIKDITIVNKGVSDIKVTEPKYIDYYYDLPSNAVDMYSDIVNYNSPEGITVASAAAAVNKLSQICNGAIYKDDKEHIVLHYSKVDALSELLDEIDDNALIAVNYKFDYELISKRLPHVEMFSDSLIKLWNNREIKAMCINPTSAGHGLNLQHGGSTIIWFGLTYSSEKYRQLNGRLDRRGQSKPVRVIHLLWAPGDKETIEPKLMDVVNEKITLAECVMDYLKKT